MGYALGPFQLGSKLIDLENFIKSYSALVVARKISDQEVLGSKLCKEMGLVSLNIFQLWAVNKFLG